MLHRKPGKTGIAVSKIALGTMYFGSETPGEEAFAILDTPGIVHSFLLNTRGPGTPNCSDQESHARP
jgi:hypothetical protein